MNVVSRRRKKKTTKTPSWLEGREEGTMSLCSGKLPKAEITKSKNYQSSRLWTYSCFPACSYFLHFLQLSELGSFCVLTSESSLSQIALLSTDVLEIQLCWVWKLKEMGFKTARYIQGMFSIELAERPSLMGFADLDAVMNFPVKSKARLTSVYCLYLRIHNREWLNARNTLNPAFWRLSELGTTTFCSHWYGRQRIDGSLTLGFFVISM